MNCDIISYLNNDENAARHYFSKFKALNTQKLETNAQILEAVIYSNYDTSAVREILSKNDSLKPLNCLIDLAAYEKSYYAAYFISSALVPGLGNILLGEVKSGLVSLAITSGMILLTRELFKNNLPINASLWGIAWGLKFYGGNVALTDKNFDKKEAHKKNELAKSCELEVLKLFEKFPLKFKEITY